MEKKRAVLVVDDDAVVGRSISRVLAERGYQVRGTLGGQEALVELDEHAYDLVFADIRMPGMDGLEMATRMRVAHPEVPVVVITGYGTEANERRARELGVAGFIRKPLAPETILASAELALRERRETREAIRRSALALAQPEPDAQARPAPEPAQRVSVARNVALFFAAPFIGLAYIVAFPFVGFWALAKFALRAAIGPR